MRKTLSFVAALAFLLSAARLDAQSFAVSHAKVELISRESALVPGRAISIGILFDMEPGWHIYWTNPGDSGEPPRVQWTLPAGLQAGDIRWPVPQKMVHGTVADYGYEGRVLLAVPVQVAADYKGGSPATLAADLRYLICREVCIPAKAQLRLSIPAPGSSAQVPATQELFLQAEKSVPKPAPANWKVQATDDGREFVIALQTGEPESKAEFLPLDEDQVDNAASQSAKSVPQGVQLTVKKSDQLLKPISSLHGLIVLGSRAIEVTAPVSVRR